MTVKELIDLLLTYPEDMPVLTGDFLAVELGMATVADFDVEKSADFLVYDKSTERRVLVVFGGDSVCASIDVGGYANHQPHYITYDHDGIRRS